jgi:hypothetical protein
MHHFLCLQEDACIVGLCLQLCTIPALLMIEQRMNLSLSVKKITCSCPHGAILTSLRQTRGSPAALLQQKIHAKHILLLNCVNPCIQGKVLEVHIH